MKKLVAYFSATGTTENVAKTIAKLLECDCFEIVPSQIYTNDDLDWRNPKSRSSVEMNEKACRPEIDSSVIGMADYDEILLGFPIWWDTAPRIINTFLESYDLAGKTIIPFATSGGSEMGKTVEHLQFSAPSSIFLEGKILNNTSKADIASWLKTLFLNFATTQAKWESLSHDEKNYQLFLKQKAMLEQFLSTGAITQEQFDKSYGDMKEKMRF